MGKTTPNPTKKTHFDKGGSHLIKQVLNMKTLAVSLVVLCLLVTNGQEASGWIFGGGNLGGTNSLSQSIGPCWETWSRCTQWSSFGTGILFQSCQDRCVSMGYSSGRAEWCVLDALCPTELGNFNAQEAEV